MSADAWGITEGYHDVVGTWHPTPSETRDALVEAMGAPGPPTRGALVIRQGEPVPLAEPVEIALEDGAAFPPGAPPREVPLGYHRMRTGGSERALIVTPSRCVLPAARAWGWAIQLYAVRSRESWGLGDLADLRTLGEWSATELGGAFVLTNPLGATAPLTPQEPSPYFPGSRCHRNPLYLRIEEVPGASALGAELEPIAAAGRALNAARAIDRDAVLRLKLDALSRLWRRAGGAVEPALDGYVQRRGELLERFAAYCVVAEEQGTADWRAWPATLRQPDAPAVRALARERADRVRFHCWVQWLLEEQLARAALGTCLVQDLPIGVDPGGADAWIWQDVFAGGTSVGAPPDLFNRRGQDWGVPPLIPWALRDAGYRPFIETVRASMRRGGGLRIDHVMGLFRLFCIPRGRPPAEGAYVRYPADDLLGIVALESQRAGAIVVGEDLGTVEAGTSERLRERGVLSCRVAWFGPEEPAGFPELTLGSVTTHDLPTIAGVWSGADIACQRAAGLEVDGSIGQLRDRLAAVAGAGAEAPLAEVVRGAYRALGAAPAALVAATPEDALEVEERPNMPGTSTEYPNWCLALPATLEEMRGDPRVHELGAILGASRAVTPGPLDIAASD